MQHTTENQAGIVTAIVTGGARRIGATIARWLHGRGLNVLIHYRGSAREAEQLAAELNQQRAHSAAVVQAELSDSDAPKQIIQAAMRQFGRVDVLINNASAFYPTPVGSIKPSDWVALIDSNLKAPLWLSLAFSKALAGQQGSIVNLVDIHGLVPLRNHVIYSQAKAGLVMQTKALAKDLAPKVRVNGVAPGSILWPEGEAAQSEEEKQIILERVPMGRSGRPEGIAAAVCFLALDADYVTGQILAVDGGRSLNM
ncbi:MAG: pteridine reductase [Pseudomonadota bacterium]